MKLKHRFMAVGAALVAVVIGAEFLNYQLNSISKQQEVAVHVIQRHMEGDMMHDGIRGNVYSAMLGMLTGESELVQASRQEIGAMGKDFLGNLEANIKADIPPSIRAQLEETKPVLIAYAGTASQLAALSDYEQAGALLPGLTEAFEALEEKQEKVSDAILAWSSGLQAQHEQLALYMNAVMITLLVIAIGLPAYAIFGVFRPMEMMARVMDRLSSGDNAVNIPYAQRRDEMGAMAKSVQVFKDNALRMDAMRAEQEAMKQESEAKRKRELLQMADGFEASVKGVVTQVASAAEQMYSGAENVTFIADDTKKRSQAVVETSSEVAQTSSQVAAAAEELTASIKEISEQTQRSSRVAGEASEKANQARDSISTLSDASARVGQVIEVITGIAGQINLLALNATIESARAGEAGKGFAVVASEVKNLASQVGRATDEITQQIQEMQGATKASVDSVMSIIGIIEQVSEGTSAVAAAVEEQSAVTNEIARNVSRASVGTHEIAQNMSSVQDGADKTGNTALELLDSAKSLTEQSADLRKKVETFIATIRSA